MTGIEDVKAAPELPPELAELAGLAAAADARNAGQDAPPGAAGAELVSAADQGAELAAMLQAVMAMAEPVAPYLPRAYTPEVCDRIGIAVAAVAEKRGWDLTKLASPEAMLAFVTIPPTLAAVKFAKDYYAWLELQAQQQARAARQPQAQPEPVTDGG
jgi:hypothetical protein